MSEKTKKGTVDLKDPEGLIALLKEGIRQNNMYRKDLEKQKEFLESAAGVFRSLDRRMSNVERECGLLEKDNRKSHPFMGNRARKLVHSLERLKGHKCSSDSFQKLELELVQGEKRSDPYQIMIIIRGHLKKDQSKTVRLDVEQSKELGMVLLEQSDFLRKMNEETGR